MVLRYTSWCSREGIVFEDRLGLQASGSRPSTDQSIAGTSQILALELVSCDTAWHYINARHQMPGVSHQVSGIDDKVM